MGLTRMGGIGFGLACELGPPGEALAHRADRVLHYSRSYLSLAGDKAPGAVALGEEQEDG
jgi:hypothetical protein